MLTCKRHAWQVTPYVCSAPALRLMCGRLVGILLVDLGGASRARAVLIGATGPLTSCEASQGYVVTGELLICCYNVLLHQATFEEPGPAP